MFNQAEQVVKIVLKRSSSKSRIHTIWFDSVLNEMQSRRLFTGLYAIKSIQVITQ